MYWNEYTAKCENKNRINEYRNYLESNFVGVNRLFVLGHSNQNDNSTRLKAQRYPLPKGVIKNYKVIIDGKSFYEQPTDSNIK